MAIRPFMLLASLNFSFYYSTISTDLIKRSVQPFKANAVNFVPNRHEVAAVPFYCNRGNNFAPSCVEVYERRMAIRLALMPSTTSIVMKAARNARKPRTETDIAIRKPRKPYSNAQ